MRQLRDQTLSFDNGVRGEHLTVVSANPRNYHAVLTGAESPTVEIDAQLFVPNEGDAPFPVVIVVPGSLGVAPSHIRHAETLNKLGIATALIDPFGARNVASTVANQAQYSFAASAYDVLAAVRTIADDPRIDAAHIGAQGHSRGGSAVLTAATSRFADAASADGPRLHGILAAYPWSGHQFTNPAIGKTQALVLMGDRDEWCSLQQVQGHLQAIRLTGGNIQLRVFAGAGHSFDRGTETETIADASVSPGAPTTYMDDDGAFIHPVTGASDADLDDRATMLYGIKAGYGRRGAAIGSNPGEAAQFDEAMVSFWTSVMARS